MHVRLHVVAGVMVVAAMAVSCSAPPEVRPPAGLPGKTSDAQVAAPLVATVAKAPTTYTQADVEQFLAAAKSAESIQDRLQQCLAYPDPPHSHWDRPAVMAYCRYRLQPMMSRSLVDSLLDGRKFAALEQGLAAALRAQQAGTDSPGLLDQIYERDFSDTSDGKRALLDGWKSSTASAFAYAASGYAYTQQAVAARGGQYLVSRASKTKMMQLLALAEADLNRAVTLNPRLTPAYVAWIRSANLGESRDYVAGIADRALSANPADYDLYAETLFTLEPEWGGSFEQMQALAELAQGHAAQNPLLRVLLTNPGSVRIDHCECGAAQQVVAYQALFDQLPITAYMWKEGDLAATLSPGVSAVFLSETLRFLPTVPRVTRALAQRSLRLTELGDPRWGLSEAKRAVAGDARDDGGYNAEAFAYEALGDYRHAEAALGSSIAVDPTQSWPLIELGNMFVVKTHQWKEAWQVDIQLIQKFPDEPAGWFLRGMIQSGQPRAGLPDTINQFNTRFGNDLQQQQRLFELRSMLERQEKGK